jgi:hypothetical protein
MGVGGQPSGRAWCCTAAKSALQIPVFSRVSGTAIRGHFTGSLQIVADSDARECGAAARDAASAFTIG